MKKIDMDNNFFDIVKWNMVNFFGYNEEDVEDTIKNFKLGSPKNDSFFLRYGSYHTASMIYHYDNNLKSTWNEWRDKNNYNNPPQEAIEHYNAHFVSNKTNYNK